MQADELLGLILKPLKQLQTPFKHFCSQFIAIPHSKSNDGDSVTVDGEFDDEGDSNTTDGTWTKSGDGVDMSGEENADGEMDPTEGDPTTTTDVGEKADLKNRDAWLRQVAIEKR